MSSSAPRRAARDVVVEQAVGGAKRLAMLPEATMRILELLQSEAYGAAELEKVVSTDPVLCMQILKVVNSAFYRSPQEIASIRRAVVMLGAAAVKNIALAASLGRGLRGIESAGLSARELWRHSLAVGAGAKLAAAAARRVPADTAFLAGLLHDVGFMLELRLDAARLARLTTSLDGGERRADGDSREDRAGDSGEDGATRAPHALLAEEAAFGATHEDFGRGLCERWGLPADIALAVGRHHVASANEDASDLACAVHIADVVAARLALGFAADAPDPELHNAALERLGLTASALEDIERAVPDATGELLRILG
ncbi:MAG TPA: HDOD domain-containing protein [Gammaproteobacteria bacterium]|nr:HDOD domain-containing protein [Gammaproteobacteria bacterium]